MDFNLISLLFAEESDLLQTELAIVLLLSLAALVAVIARRIPQLPYTVALVIVGLVLSFFPNPFNIDLSSELILSILVPPLIFEATLNLKWENLRKNLVPILLLAVVGTFVGALIVSGILVLASRTFLPELILPFTAAFAFGALISATDPVAVIALFRDLGVSKRLAILVEGESLFNDGVAIVIFNLALVAGISMASGSQETFNLTSAIIEFLRVFLGGIIVGILLGYLVSTIILKNVDDHLVETATTVALAFGAFILAEQLEVSGLLAVVGSGILVGNIGLRNTSPTTQITLQNFWEFAAFVVNSMVFLLIGLDADLREFQPNVPFVIVAVIAVLFSRSIVVYSITTIYSWLSRRHSIPVPYRHVMFWGGLRGAISLALALSLTGEAFGDVVATEIRLMAFGVVLFTLLVQGPTLAPLLRFLGLSDQPEPERLQQRQQAQLYASRAGRRELERLYEDGIVSTEVYQAMRDVYTGELRRRSRKLRDLLHEFPELEQNMMVQARKDLHQAERTALGDVARRGLISEEVYHELIKETDNRAAALDMIQDAMGLQTDE